MRAVFDDHGPRAERAGIALLTAMGFDYAPGDMLAALAAEDMGALDEIVLAYSMRGFGASRGTAKSAIGMLRGRRRRMARRGARARIPERRPWQLRVSISRSAGSA